jgi:hypothetical protein
MRRTVAASVASLLDLDLAYADGLVAEKELLLGVATPWCSTVNFRRIEKSLILKDFCAVQKRWRRGRDSHPR